MIITPVIHHKPNGESILCGYVAKYKGAEVAGMSHLESITALLYQLKLLV